VILAGHREPSSCLDNTLSSFRPGRRYRAVIRRPTGWSTALRRNGPAEAGTPTPEINSRRGFCVQIEPLRPLSCNSCFSWLNLYPHPNVACPVDVTRQWLFIQQLTTTCRQLPAPTCFVVKPREMGLEPFEKVPDRPMCPRMLDHEPNESIESEISGDDRYSALVCCSCPPASDRGRTPLACLHTPLHPIHNEERRYRRQKTLELSFFYAAGELSQARRQFAWARFTICSKSVNLKPKQRTRSGVRGMSRLSRLPSTVL